MLGPLTTALLHPLLRYPSCGADLFLFLFQKMLAMSECNNRDPIATVTPV
jgi:hypothetical protein